MPSTSKNAMRVPSGDQVAPIGWVVSLVSWRSWPVAMSRTQSCSSAPPLSDEYTSLVPSGDHAGSVSRKRSFVMFSAAPPIGITQMSPTAAKATFDPSGEITGRTMPSTFRGAREVKSRATRV